MPQAEQPGGMARAELGCLNEDRLVSRPAVGELALGIHPLDQFIHGPLTARLNELARDLTQQPDFLINLGQAYRAQGDTAKAKAAYQDFLTLWKDADPDIPILKQVKAEYAKFQ